MVWTSQISGLGKVLASTTDRLKRLVGFGPAPSTVHPRQGRQVTHVVIFDGTMSSLEDGYETHAGMLFNLLQEVARSQPVSLHYEAGIQWQGLHRALNVMAGVGLNQQIRRAYGHIASRYKPGDRIFLFGYSRGAYAARSLAGVIDQVGLLKAEKATERNVREAFRHYRRDPNSIVAESFSRAHCFEETPIEMIGVWDTVRALGLRLPVLWRFAPVEHEFHNHDLGCTVRHGFHALALNERRRAFSPILWERREGYDGGLEQVWFPGSHGDIGGHLLGYEEARGFSNLSFVWMTDKAEGCGLPLPEGWRKDFPTDVLAPSVGMNGGWGKLFLLRRRRIVGRHASEQMHSSVAERQDGVKRRLPWLPVFPTRLGEDTA